MRVLLILFLPVLALSLNCPSYTKTVNGEWQVTHRRICDAGKFCTLTKEHDVDLKGDCHHTDHYTKYCVPTCLSSCVCCENATCIQDFINSLTATPTAVPLKSTIMPPCFDHVKEDHCHTIPDICQHEIAKDVCPRFCGLCTDNTGSGVTTHHPVSVASNCIDHNEFCCSDPDICKNQYGSLICVNTCSNNTLGALPTQGACFDTVPFCQTNNICNDPDFAEGPCKKTCGFCSISSTQPTTSEKVTTTTTMLKTTMKPTTMLKTTLTTTTMLKTTATTTAITMKPTTTKALPITTTQKATQCYQCGDIDTHTYCDGIDLIMPTLKACPHSQPYCVTDIFLSTNDMPQFIRRCSNRDRCIKDWWEGTSDRPLCVDSDPTLATVTATCTYCCVTDGCNQDNVPLKSTFFKP